MMHLSDFIRMVLNDRDEEAPENNYFFSLNALVRLLAPDDPIDLLTAVAALQLIPENADRGVRLEALAHICVARRHCQRRSPVRRSRLRHICEYPALRRLAPLEDPFPNPFTENFTFDRGSFTVFPGRFDETTFVLRHLVMAVFRCSEPFPDEQFLTDTHALITAVLVISNEIARRAGLRRGAPPRERPGRAILVPSRTRLQQLKRAVSFQCADLADLLLAYGVPLAALDVLTTEFGHVAIDPYRVDNGALFARPIVRVGERLIVALPGQLLAAVRHTIVVQAWARGFGDELAQRYHSAVAFTAHESLAWLGHHPMWIEPHNIPDVPLLGVGFQSMDTDKLIYVAVLTHSLQQYHEQAVYGLWDVRGIIPQIAEHVREIVEAFREEVAPGAHILFLLLVQGVGHVPFLTDPGGDLPLTLGMTIADLQTIAWLPDRDVLTLWKFACAGDRVRRHAYVHTTSVLDEYELYRRCGQSYGLPDPEEEAGIILFPIGAGRLRREVVATYDPHTVAGGRPGFSIEVVWLYGPGSAPIAVPARVARAEDDPVAVVVEGYGVPIWITSPPDQAMPGALRFVYTEFTETIAYWLWRCTPGLAPLLASLTMVAERLHLQVHLTDPEAWAQSWTIEADTDKDVIVVEINQADVRINITILPAAQRLFFGPDNGGERLLLVEILRGIRALVPDSEVLSDDALARLVDRYLPLSDQKRMVTLDLGAAPEFDARGIPRYRPVCSADTAELLDELTIHLKTSTFPRGVQLPSHRKRLLQHVVTFFYMRLERLVATLDPVGLLEHLVTHHEAVVYSNAAYEWQAHTSLELRRSVRDEWAAELPMYSSTAMASRFLLEYVVARPPNGEQPFSLSTYDRLLALADLIIHWGQLDDLIHYEVMDIEITLQESGRITLNRERYARANAAYLAALAGQGLPSAAEFLERYLPRETEQERPPIVERFDRAAVAEWGLSLSEIMDFFDEAILFGREVDDAAATLPLAKFESEVAHRLSWPHERVVQALDLLALHPRHDFMKPPQGHTKGDVYPWRFNRSLSYARRPFLMRPLGETTEIVWGIRHVAVARHHLLRLCFERRLQAKSQEMLRLLGELNALAGAPFNNEVADLFRLHNRMGVYVQVARIGSLQLPRQLGDVDVVVIDSSRRRLLLLECKTLAVARTPQEMGTEIRRLFTGSTNELSVVERHTARARWFEAHLSAVLAEFRVATAGPWIVQAIIVVDTELFTPFLITAPLPVLSYAAVARALEQDRIWVLGTQQATNINAF